MREPNSQMSLFFCNVLWESLKHQYDYARTSVHVYENIYKYNSTVLQHATRSGFGPSEQTVLGSSSSGRRRQADHASSDQSPETSSLSLCFFPSLSLSEVYKYGAPSAAAGGLHIAPAQQLSSSRSHSISFAGALLAFAGGAVHVSSSCTLIELAS